MQYANRVEAGKALASHLNVYATDKNVIVLALPRGGVPVAYEVANILKIPLDVFIVRKLGVPGHEELAMGAITMDGEVVFNQRIVRDLHISQSEVDRVIKEERAELTRRMKAYRGDRPFPNLKNKTIILVDDGIATGATIRAAILSLRRHQPTSIVVAVPVASDDACNEMKQLADKVICPLSPENLYAVGQWYEDFSQTTDAEVHHLLQLNSDHK